MALGESEVLGQVRTALRLARETGSTRAVLHRMFESAVAAGKRVRTETAIARHPLSVPSIGFELATKVFGQMSEQTILVLGAGETGTLFARQAIEAGVRDVRIANRSLERAAALAEKIGGTARLVGGARGGSPGGGSRRGHDGEPGSGASPGGRRGSHAPAPG